MAVENDYNLLVFTLNDLAATIDALRDEVEKRLLQEKQDGLEPNETNWVNLLSVQMLQLHGPIGNLRDGAWNVLNSRPGEAIFTAQPPEPPDAPPST